MKKHIRLLAAILSLLLTVAMLPSCGRESVTARESLSSLLRLFGNVPAGGIYATAPLEGDNTLDEGLIASLYRRADGYLEYDGRVCEAAVYLGSVQDPFFDAAVFVCYGNADTRAILEMCMRRVRLAATAHTIDSEDAVLAVSGRTVICIITKDTATADRVIDKLL